MLGCIFQLEKKMTNISDEKRIKTWHILCVNCVNNSTTLLNHVHKHILPTACWTAGGPNIICHVTKFLWVCEASKTPTYTQALIFTANSRLHLVCSTLHASLCVLSWEEKMIYYQLVMQQELSIMARDWGYVIVATHIKLGIVSRRGRRAWSSTWL